MSATNGRRGREAYGHRLRRMREHGMKPPLSSRGAGGKAPRRNATIDCGWGRLIFGQTFENTDELVAALAAEAPERRDIAFYVRDPHVVLSCAPQELFLDPSHTYRLDLATFHASRIRQRGFHIRRLSAGTDIERVNRVLVARGMVPVPPQFFTSRRNSRSIVVLVATDEASGDVVGTVMGVDHARAFNDPQRGASLWCLAVDPQATHPGIGIALVHRLADYFKARGAAFLDLSVMHDNEQAIGLYEKLGFVRVPFFAVKRKNPINEHLFAGPRIGEALNPYARIIIDEARRRGIHVDIDDAAGGFFTLSFGGRSVRCREALSELTSGVAVSICDDKAVARRMAARAGLAVPDQIEVSGQASAEAFLAQHGRVVVKPACGEQGRGVAVGIETPDGLASAIEAARLHSQRVLIEECVEGEDLRLLVIGFRLVAAGVRRPARVVGDGRSPIRALIEHQSRRRAAATGGESRIPLDAETERCLSAAGHGLDDILDEGVEVAVRKTANLHTGGTIHDVTEQVHPRLIEAAVTAARAIDIPVVGIDLIVASPTQPDYAFIEANERPGLANHEPQPTAERFVDLLFPLSMPAAARRAASGRAAQQCRA